MLDWERVPIIGRNAVFCFEARRLWRRRTVLVLVVVVLGLGAAGWALRWLLRTAIAPPPGGSSVGWLMTFYAAFVLGQGLPVPWAPAVGEPSRWLQGAGWVAMVLYWLGLLGARWFVPALAALSLASDRAGQRLEPLLASGLSLREVLIGKLMAPAVPFLGMALGTAAVSAHIALEAAWPAYLAVLWPLNIILGIFAGAMVGLRVGASARQPTVALAISILITGVVLPVAMYLAGGIVAGLLAGRMSVRPGLLVAIVFSAVRSALLGIIFAALWFSTKRALARVAE